MSTAVVGTVVCSLQVAGTAASAGEVDVVVETASPTTVTAAVCPESEVELETVCGSGEGPAKLGPEFDSGGTVRLDVVLIADDCPNTELPDAVTWVVTDDVGKAGLPNSPTPDCDGSMVDVTVSETVVDSDVGRTLGKTTCSGDPNAFSPCCDTTTDGSTTSGVAALTEVDSTATASDSNCRAACPKSVLAGSM